MAKSCGKDFASVWWTVGLLGKICCQSAVGGVFYGAFLFVAHLCDLCFTTTCSVELGHARMA